MEIIKNKLNTNVIKSTQEDLKYLTEKNKVVNPIDDASNLFNLPNNGVTKIINGTFSGVSSMIFTQSVLSEFDELTLTVIFDDSSSDTYLYIQLNDQTGGVYYTANPTSAGYPYYRISRGSEKGVLKISIFKNGSMTYEYRGFYGSDTFSNGTMTSVQPAITKIHLYDIATASSGSYLLQGVKYV